MDEAENKITTNTVQGLAQGTNQQITMNYYGQGPPLASPPHAWNIPYQRNSLFIGRDDLLIRLHERLMFNTSVGLTQPQVISGLGGIGKTQIAIEYAYRYNDEYRMVLWASAQSIDTVNYSYLEIARVLNLPEKEAPEQEIIIQAVKTWLQNHR